MLNGLAELLSELVPRNLLCLFRLTRSTEFDTALCQKKRPQQLVTPAYLDPIDRLLLRFPKITSGTQGLRVPFLRSAYKPSFTQAASEVKR
jgi:hypothetical protein